MDDRNTRRPASVVRKTRCIRSRDSLTMFKERIVVEYVVDRNENIMSDLIDDNLIMKGAILL